MQHWNWGIPVTIPEPPGASPQPQDWNQLKFNQLGLFDLCHRIGVFALEPGVYNNHRTQFDATDLAWFAAGLSTEVLDLAQNSFPPELSTLRHTTIGSQARSALRTCVQKLCFDLVCIIQMCYNMVLMYCIQATLWDRSFGGATLIIHVEGATHPNALMQPKYIKSDVYFPGYLIKENPHFSPIISKLVQKYIVNIGMPVIERWERCARLIWSMTQGKDTQVPLPYPSQPIQPYVTPRGSSTFIYNGCPLSFNPSVIDEYKEDEEELNSAMVELLNVIEECEKYKSQVETTQAALHNSLAREEQLKSELDNTRAMLRNTSPRLDVAHYTSPIAHPTTPSSHNQFNRFSHVSPTPPSHRDDAFKSLSPANQVTCRLFSNAVASPSCCEGSSESNGSVSASSVIDVLTEYYNFLNSHKIMHLKSTLDVIHHTFPISSWALQLEGAGVPLDLIDSTMIFMVAANT